MLSPHSFEILRLTTSDTQSPHGDSLIVIFAKVHAASLNQIFMERHCQNQLKDLNAKVRSHKVAHNRCVFVFLHPLAAVILQGINRELPKQSITDPGTLKTSNAHTKRAGSSFKPVCVMNEAGINDWS